MLNYTQRAKTCSVPFGNDPEMIMENKQPESINNHQGGFLFFAPCDATILQQGHPQKKDDCFRAESA